MTVVALCLLVALVGTVWHFTRALARQDEEHHDTLKALLARADRERQGLLERIQRPERSLVPASEQFVFPDAEPDEIDKVGTIAEPSEEDIRYLLAQEQSVAE